MSTTITSPGRQAQAAGGIEKSSPSLKGNEEGKTVPYRRLYWFGCGFGWVVWTLMAAAAGDEHWGELPTGDGYGVGTGFVLDACDGGDADSSFCAAHTNFAGCQITAAVLCSLAVLFFTVSFFRPLEARRGSSKILGLAGGVSMAFFSFFQLMSFLFLAKSIQEYNGGWAHLGTQISGDAYMAETGVTYGVGVAAFVLGLIQAAVVLVFFRQAGHGPLSQCAERISAPDELGATVVLPPRSFLFYDKNYEGEPPVLTVNPVD